MSDYIKIQLGDGNYHYVNLENITKIEFKEKEYKVEFLHSCGVAFVSSSTNEGYKSLKDIINKEMEKRLLQ